MYKCSKILLQIFARNVNEKLCINFYMFMVGKLNNSGDCYFVTTVMYIDASDRTYQIIIKLRLNKQPASSLFYLHNYLL